MTTAYHTVITYQILEYTCSKYCNLIHVGLSEVHYSDRDLQLLQDLQDCAHKQFFSILVLPETELFFRLTLILLPHAFPSSWYYCQVGSCGTEKSGQGCY